MLTKIYDAFIKYYLKDRQYINTERAYMKESTEPVNKPEALHSTEVELGTSDMSSYDYLKSIYLGSGKLYTGEIPDHFQTTYLQLKEFINQSLEEFSVISLIINSVI